MKEQIYKKKKKKKVRKFFLFLPYGISHIFWSALSDVANRKKHRSTCAAKRPSRRLPGTVTRLKYNCANFHYFLISTEQQCPPPFLSVHGKIHRGRPHKSHWLSVPDGYSQLTHACVCVSLYTSVMLLLIHLCCARVMYKHIAYGRKNTLYFHVDISSYHVRPCNGLFFVEKFKRDGRETKL